MENEALVARKHDFVRESSAVTVNGAVQRLCKAATVNSYEIEKTD